MRDDEVPAPARLEPPEFMTRAEVARLARRCTRTIQNWDGEVTHKIVIRGRVYYRRSEIMALFSPKVGVNGNGEP